MLWHLQTETPWDIREQFPLQWYGSTDNFSGCDVVALCVSFDADVLENVAGLVTLISPAVMLYALMGPTGKALLERRMKKRPDFEAYVRRTSGFFPLPPKA